ncbi:uncharacterized protein LOC121177240 [Toxotes jaculatrix]|uniref:uncharacterized protein LOC121177240 n=1 Tax=Toxotes jaculatrix TaxID=941984 RepID=UPI001B3A90CB|nr:uncharacterized protein LOC121177240 [Toxotes jaculatrix]
MMTPLKLALCLSHLFLGSSAQATDLISSLHIRQESGYYPANVGDSVTLRCFYEGRALMFYWYKQTLGQKPRLVSTFYQKGKNTIFHNEFKNNTRFTLDAADGKNHLKISDLHISDSATYYCISFSNFKLAFGEGAVVSVKGSGMSIQALVHQSASETVQPGGSVTLNCTVHTGTCDGEHSVYWFRNSEESQPGLIYTHGDRNDQCERKPDTQTHTCFYNLPIRSQNLSYAGTSDCAVASCGLILFGNKKQLDLKHKDPSLALVYILSGALAFTTILVVLLTYATYTMNNRKSCKCRDARWSLASTPNAEDYLDSDNLHYAALREHKVNRPRRQGDNTQAECVYSAVRR